MSNSSTNPPAPQNSNSSNSLSSILGILLSPFLWVATVSVGFIIYTLWPEGSSKPDEVVEPTQSSGFFLSLWRFVIGILPDGIVDFMRVPEGETLNGEQFIVLVALLAGLGVVFKGFHLIWKDGPSELTRVPAKLVIALLTLVVAGVLILGTDGFSNLLQESGEAQDSWVYPLQQAANDDIKFEKALQQMFSWQLLAIVFGVPILLFLIFSKGGQATLKELAKPLVLAATVLGLAYLLSANDWTFNSGSANATTTNAAVTTPAAPHPDVKYIKVPGCQGDMRWSEPVFHEGWNITTPRQWGWGVLRFRGLKDGHWVELNRGNAGHEYDAVQYCAKVSSYAGKTMGPLVWTPRL